MIDITKLQQAKAQCLLDLREALPRYEERLKEIDGRLLSYAEDCVRDDVDIHNIDELLCLRRLLRYLDTYEYDIQAVHQAIRDAEGTWDGMHHVGRDVGGKHIDDGLLLDGIYGRRHYRLTEIQVLFLAYVFGPKAWRDTKSGIGSRELLPTERENEATGTIEDLRRVVTEFILEWPRKVAKTWVGAFVQFHGLLHAERDYQGYIAANGQEQSKLLYSMLCDMLRQKDAGPKKKFRITATECSWLPWTGRSGKVMALSAGGKTKDGLKASRNSFDEFGAAQRVKEHCDMEGLINVLQGSQGPIREPLNIHTSTAGLGNETPYELLIRNFQKELLSEMDTPLDGQPHQRPNDWQAGHMLHPDAWELEDAELRTERVIRKVNPNLGITIQPQYYEDEWKKADQQGEMKRKEVVTKLYNVFQTDKAVDWIRPDEIRALQVDRRIEDCKAEDGWVVIAGMDFTNVGDDLQALSYLAVRQLPSGRREFFADLDAWMAEEALERSTLRNLLRQYADMGYMHVVPGSVLSPSLPVDRCVQLRNQYNVQLVAWGYDPFKANEPKNLLKDWLISLRVQPQNVGNYVVPVKQGFASFNPVVDEITYSIRCPEPLIRFSPNPLWPWQFGNCILLESTDGMENKRPVKRSQDAKCDSIQALLNAWVVFDQLNGKVSR